MRKTKLSIISFLAMIGIIGMAFSAFMFDQQVADTEYGMNLALAPDITADGDLSITDVDFHQYNVGKTAPDGSQLGYDPLGVEANNIGVRGDQSFLLDSDMAACYVLITVEHTYTPGANAAAVTAANYTATGTINGGIDQYIDFVTPTVETFTAGAPDANGEIVNTITLKIALTWTNAPASQADYAAVLAAMQTSTIDIEINFA